MNDGSLNHVDITAEATAFLSNISLEKLQNALTLLADRDVVLVHNHPFNLPQPSKKDKEATGFLGSLLALCGIKLHDHLIVSPYGYFSFRANGVMEDFIPGFTADAPPCTLEAHDIGPKALRDTTLISKLMKDNRELLIGKHRIICAKSFSGFSLITLMLLEKHNRTEEDGCVYIFRQHAAHSCYVHRVINPHSVFLYDPDTRKLVDLPRLNQHKVPDISTGESLFEKIKSYFPAPYRAFHAVQIEGQ